MRTGGGKVYVDDCGQHCDNRGVTDQPSHELSELLEATLQVRVFDAIGFPPAPPARKRRDRVALSGPLAEVEGDKAIGELRTALAARSSPGTLPWMCWPNLMLELVGVGQALVGTVGLIHPSYLRWDPLGDMDLLSPKATDQWLRQWAPKAVALWPRGPGD